MGGGHNLEIEAELGGVSISWLESRAKAADRQQFPHQKVT
jgi:hypothetical protein